MTSPLLRLTTLMGAVFTMGMVAGTFALYAHTIMPGLRQTDDRTFVAAFQQIDRAIINPWFMITAFGGALVLTVAAGLANRGTPAFPLDRRRVRPLPGRGHRHGGGQRPPQRRDQGGGRPGPHRRRAGPRPVRRGPLGRWNLLRVATSVPAFALLTWALVLCGRATA